MINKHILTLRDGYPTDSYQNVRAPFTTFFSFFTRMVLRAAGKTHLSHWQRYR